MGGTEGRERRWCGNLWRLRYVAPTAATSPTCARTNRPHRSRRLSQRQSLSHPARHAWDDLRGWPLRRPLSQAGSAGLPTLAAGPDHADAVRGGLSDRQAAEAVRARIDWKCLLGLELSDPGFDFSVLCEFRDRLLAGGAQERLLERVLEVARELGVLKARGRQRTDSTHVL